MPKLRLMAVVFALGACVLSVRPTAAPAATKTAKMVASLKQGIDFHRQATWRWEKLMFKSPTRTEYRERRVSGVGYLKWAARLWSKRRIVAKKKAQNPPRRRAWLCISEHEDNDDPKKGPTGWRTNTRNSYYGGLQMDLTFQRLYGEHLLKKKGTADRWTPLEQMWVAEKAYRSGRGFYPWPNTARACGLI